MGGNPLREIARSPSGIRRGKPAFTSRTATAFSDHKAAHVRMLYSAADWCCSAAFKGGFRQLSSDERRQVMTESCPRYHLKRFAPECYSSQRVAAAGFHFEVHPITSSWAAIRAAVQQLRSAENPGRSEEAARHCRRHGRRSGSHRRIGVLFRPSGTWRTDGPRLVPRCGDRARPITAARPRLDPTWRTARADWHLAEPLEELGRQATRAAHGPSSEF